MFPQARVILGLSSKLNRTWLSGRKGRCNREDFQHTLLLRNAVWELVRRFDSVIDEAGEESSAFALYLTKKQSVRGRYEKEKTERKREKGKILTCEGLLMSTLLSLRWPNQDLTSLGSALRSPSAIARSMTESEGERLSRSALTIERAISGTAAAH